MYFVWNLHDCFFRALAARYWALVPCRGGDGGRRRGEITEMTEWRYQEATRDYNQMGFG